MNQVGLTTFAAAARPDHRRANVQDCQTHNYRKAGVPIILIHIQPPELVLLGCLQRASLRGADFY